LNKKIIAVVDDDQPLLLSLENLLESLGYQVRPHLSAEALLLSGDMLAVDCLISDVGMPGMSGFDLLERVRIERATLPVILITGRSADFMKEKAIDAGARFYFEKPLDSNKLIAAISSVLGGAAVIP
jgi:two-component system response regulator FixJ